MIRVQDEPSRRDFLKVFVVAGVVPLATCAKKAAFSKKSQTLPLLALQQAP
jgi:hypothetical protein